MNRLLIIGAITVVVLISVGIFVIYQMPKATNGKVFNPNLETAGPPTNIYKTKGDYYNLVPIGLSENKSQILMYPDIRDVYYKGQLAYPTRLNQGYLLDNRGIFKTSAFLNITYEEYSKLPNTPSTTELFGMILDGSPFTEFYYCGDRYQFNEDNEVAEINAIIDSGQLSKCRKLI